MHEAHTELPQVAYASPFLVDTIARPNFAQVYLCMGKQNAAPKGPFRSSKFQDRSLASLRIAPGS